MFILNSASKRAQYLPSILLLWCLHFCLFHLTWSVRFLSCFFQERLYVHYICFWSSVWQAVKVLGHTFPSLTVGRFWYIIFWDSNVALKKYTWPIWFHPLHVTWFYCIDAHMIINIWVASSECFVDHSVPIFFLVMDYTYGP